MMTMLMLTVAACTTVCDGHWQVRDVTSIETSEAAKHIVHFSHPIVMHTEKRIFVELPEKRVAKHPVVLVPKKH
jgi:hypothetical protein